MISDLIKRDLDVLSIALTRLSFKYSELKVEEEGQEYGACSIVVNNKKILIRSAKTTPKKIGQFVTLWKRNDEGITEPLHETDHFDLVVINVRDLNRIGQFVFSKESLIENTIITTSSKEGKRGFRVYPSWVETINKQAIKSQKKQLQSFVDLSSEERLNFDDLNKQYKLLMS